MGSSSVTQRSLVEGATSAALLDACPRDTALLALAHSTAIAVRAAAEAENDSGHIATRRGHLGHSRYDG
eukprot:3716713-Rhodomonas_salina.1